jgi:type I restriction enzyme S subunit
MSKLHDLIQELCPNGVEFKKLGEIAFYPKDRISKDDMSTYIGVENLLKDKQGKADPEEISNDGIEFLPNDILVGNIRPYLKKIWMADVRGGTNGDVCLFRIKEEWADKIMPSFLYQLLASDDFFLYANQYAKGAKMPRGDKSKHLEYEIPLPPLAVQEEIVNILDRFAEYAAELQTQLQAELQARKEQYEYYRNLLLSFTPASADDASRSVTNWGGISYEVEWRKMGEIGEFIRGNGLQKKDFTEEGVGCIHYGQIYTYYGTFANETKSYVSESLAKKLLQVYPGNLVIACTSENVEDVGKAVAWLGDSTIVTGGHSVVFRHTQNPKYIAYFFQTDSFFAQKKKYAFGAKVIDIKAADLAKIEIPIPPLALQEEIVKILDRFETLVNDLTQGLPAEIAARKEQYEYYRNRLLTFERM